MQHAIPPQSGFESRHRFVFIFFHWLHTPELVVYSAVISMVDANLAQQAAETISMHNLQSLKANRLLRSISMPLTWICAAVLLNLILLIAYQHYVAGDFPFQDEWGYVDRLHRLPEMGFFHYLFDQYQVYYMPVFMLIWYFFYAFTHLDIMAIRYTGAAVCALVSLALCAMLYRKMTHPTLLSWLMLLCTPFLVCSLNHRATYHQSIESLIEPLLFGMVLLGCWAAEGTLRKGHVFVWSGICVLCGLIAGGIYAPGLALLPAIVGARLLLRPKIDLVLIVLGVVGVIMPIWYVMAGHGLDGGANTPAYGSADLLSVLQIWVGLVGNAVFSPVFPGLRLFTYLLGVGILLAQTAAVVHVLRLPAAERERFMLPMALTLYNVLVFVEIVAARLHSPDVAFTPRYTVHMLSGPISLLFWAVTLGDAISWRRWFAIGILGMFLPGMAAAETVGLVAAPYVRHSFIEVRAGLLSLHAPPVAGQNAVLWLNPPMIRLVYTDLLFLESHHLAMYHESAETTIKDPLAITAFGPDNIIANAPFNQQPDHRSALWFKMNRRVAGEIRVVIDGTAFPAVGEDAVVTVGLPTMFFTHSGSYPVYVLESSGSTMAESSPALIVVH